MKEHRPISILYPPPDACNFLHDSFRISLKLTRIFPFRVLGTSPCVTQTYTHIHTHRQTHTYEVTRARASYNCTLIIPIALNLEQSIELVAREDRPRNHHSHSRGTVIFYEGNSRFLRPIINRISFLHYSSFIIRNK